MIYPQNFEQKIGFDNIRHMLKEKCLSTLGQERVDEMIFSDNYAEICQRLQEVDEFIRIIQEEDGFPDQYFFDVRPSLKRIRVEGMYTHTNKYMIVCIIRKKQIGQMMKILKKHKSVFASFSKVNEVFGRFKK